MAETIISLDDGNVVLTEMPYSDVLNLLTHVNQSTAFVEFTNTAGHKEAVSPTHAVEVYESQR